MGLLDLFKGKKKDTPKSVQKEPDPNELSDPGKPTADTVDLVSVIAIDDPFLITKEGAFVLMFEIPEIDMDIYGQTEAELCERYQMTLGALPPGTKFQLTVFEEPFDPSEDIRYFTERSEAFQQEIAYMDPTSLPYIQGKDLASSCIAMIARTAEIYDTVKPIRRRTVITLYYLPGAANVARNIVMGQYAEADIAEIRKGKDSAMENLEKRISILQSAFAGAGLPLVQLTPPEALNAIWRTMHPFSSNDPEVTASDIAKNMVLGEEIYKKNPPELEEWTVDMKPEEISSMLSPNYVIERKDMLEIDGVLIKGYVVYDFRPNRPTHMYRLNSLSGSWLGTLFVEVMDPAVAADKLSQRETQLSAQEMVKAKQGMLIDFGVRQEVSAVQESRMQLETAGQAPINIRFFVFRTALLKKELENRCREMESLFKTIGVAAFPADYTQKHLWRSYIPLGVMCTEQKRRNMNAPALSTFFCPQRKRYNEEDGIYMGFDESTNLPLFLDPFGAANNKTPTFLSIGRPGAGKSVWLKTMMTSAMISGGRVMAVDIEGEMEEYCLRKIPFSMENVPSPLSMMGVSAQHIPTVPNMNIRSNKGKNVVFFGIFEPPLKSLLTAYGFCIVFREGKMIDFLKKDYGFSVLFIILLCLSIFCSCEKSEELSIEDRINAFEPAEDKGSAWITIGEKTFLFTKETLYVDSWGGFFSGKQNIEIDDSLVGKYCLAGWGKKDASRLLLLDVSGWQQPLFTMRSR